MAETRSWYRIRPWARNAPNKRSSATYSSAVWLRLCAFALGLLLASTASAQILETVIRLPDTLGPLNGPYCLAWDDNPAHPRLYVGGEGDSGGVIVAEAITCKRLAWVSTGPVKALCFVALHGKLYVAKAGSNSVAVVDCATNHVVSTIHVANEAPALLYNCLNDRLYCGGSSVSALDCAGDTLVHTIPVAATVFTLDSASGKLYAGSNGPLSVIDCAGDSVVATIPRVDSAGALCYNPTAGKVYATSGDTLFAVDSNHDSVVASLHFTGLGPILTFDPQRNRIYCTYSGNWASIDCAGDSVILTTHVGLTASFLACDVTRDRLYLTVPQYDPVLAVYDATAGQYVTEVDVDGLPSGSGWCPGLDRVYCLPDCVTEPHYYQSCLVSAVSGAGDSIAGLVPLTMVALAISLDTVHNRLYFMYSGGPIGCIGTVDCSCNIVTSYAYAGESPGPICYNPNNDRLYWSTGAYTGTNATITVFDCAGDSVVKRIPTIGGVQACQLHVGLNKLYAQAFDETLGKNAIYVVDCDHDSVTSRIILHGDYLKKSFLVPEDNRLWYLGTNYVIAIDCVGDSVAADALDNLGSIDDACACPEDRKIYTSDGDVIDMDNPGHVGTIQFWGNRFCYVPGAHKLYACGNEEYPTPHSVFLVLDTRNDTVTATFDGPCQVSGMCLDHTGDYVYSAGYEDSLVFVTDTRADSVVATVRTSTWAAARDPLVTNRRTSRIYEAQFGSMYGNGIPVIRDSLLIGLEELKSAPRPWCARPTLVSRSVPLRAVTRADLYDASGRKVAVLRPRLNDISQLVPGVYFLCEAQARAQAQATQKLVITR